MLRQAQHKLGFFEPRKHGTTEDFPWNGPGQVATYKSKDFKTRFRRSAASGIAATGRGRKRDGPHRTRARRPVAEAPRHPRLKRERVGVAAHRRGLIGYETFCLLATESLRPTEFRSAFSVVSSGFPDPERAR